MVLALRKANFDAEDLPYNKSALCRSACPALSFVLLQFVYVLVCQGHDHKTSRVGKVPAAIQSHTRGVFRISNP